MAAVANGDAQEQAKPTVFIGSSSEALAVVNRLVGLMASWFSVRPWNQVFTSGDYTFDTLLREVELADAAVFVFAKDDKLGFRGEATFSARDNVILEYGLFVAAIGRDRVLILEEQDVKLPSDVVGIKTDQFPSDQIARNAALAEFTEKARRKWEGIEPRQPSTGDIPDGGLGYAKTLRAEREKLDAVADKLAEFSRDRRAVAPEPLELGSVAAPISTYSEALGLVQHRFWTTTFLSSGFWTQPHGGVINANEEMLRRVRAASGEARRLFLLDQPAEMVVQAYRDHRVLQRQLQKYDELRELADEHRHLKNNMRRLLDQGFEVRAVFDEEKLYESLLPKEMVWDPKDSELAIYDDWRLDVFEGGSRVIHGVRSYSPATRYFGVYFDAAVSYFDELWQRGLPMAEFIDDLQDAVNSASSKIDYESNWLAIYEYALSEEDEKLKTVELARVEEVIRDATREGNLRVGRYLDVGTCTARYPINLRGCVAEDGRIIGIDEDFDCVRFSQANVRRLCPEDDRIEITQSNFTARQLNIRPSFDVITCMLGTLSHFGWDRKPSYEDSLQRALDRMAELLSEDGLLFLGTWSDYACKNRSMLGIYRQTDRERLAAWTPTLTELDERLEKAGLEVVDRVSPRLPLDLTWCRRARQ
ncbi:MAG: nucleotide-binding protein [Actinomycetota bacterium]|nr:nucleotide-binding protein [Actinomycetota bacterium]